MASKITSLSTGSPLGRFLRRRFTNPHGKYSFLESCPPKSRVLDVGCGNDSPTYFKALRPDIYYVGLDVADYLQTSHAQANEYILASPEDFARTIAEFQTPFDAIVSAHNLEHCNDPQTVLRAILDRTVPGGRVYLSFPSEATVSFPSRDGCLNFYDDPTHIYLPEFARICDTIKEAGFKIDYASACYRPLFKALIGLTVEPLSVIRHRVMPGTWALYGFEAIIWASRSS